MNKVDDSELVNETVGSAGMTDEELIDSIVKESEAEINKSMAEEAEGVKKMFSKWEKEKQRGNMIVYLLSIISGLAIASFIVLAVKNKVGKN